MFMPNESRMVEETGTYSTYFDTKNLKVVKKLDLDGLPPAKVINRLCEKAEKYHDNKKLRDEERDELVDKIDELDKREMSEVYN